MLSLDLIQRASQFLDGRVRKTPLEHSPDLSDVLGVPVWLKLENLQLTGSFKLRGAWFACAQLYDDGVRHVATCSAGNHGLAVAFAAKKLGMQATIYVPASVDDTKYRSMIRLGAGVEVSEFGGYDRTERWALEQSSHLGLPFLSAYDDELIMAGNGGTVALEVLSQLPEASSFVMPVGGGGHAAGFSYTITEHDSNAQFIVCQHEQSPAFRLSMEKGSAVMELPGIETVASGLEGGIGENTFAILKDRVQHVALLSEPELKEAMKWMIDRHQYIIEGSAAAAVAACLKNRFPAPQGPTVVFVSGRNVSLDTVRKVLRDPS